MYAITAGKPGSRLVKINIERIFDIKIKNDTCIIEVKQKLNKQYHIMTLIYKTANIEDVSKINELLNKADKISKPIMTIYEFDKIMGMRTQQLASGAAPFIDMGAEKLQIESNMELRNIALRELEEGRLPYIIERVLSNKRKEYYRICDLNLVAIRDRMRK
jgi:DNA-directed RNA polymerase subunit K/omega